ncbi:MAG: cytochrome c [Acidobacteria bacterium]|jgi:ubiquinol-cytochrome c reductase cytochrome c subunit|nr:cytochrome c [Acidobacteriota bacterium]MCZ6877451.1 cytochrome c [Acidobacteriota bacterium]
MQIKNRHIPIAVAVLTLVAGIRLGTAATQEDQPTDRGKKDFVEMGCFQCHGYQGHGGRAGPRIAPKPLSLEAFTRLVRKPPNVMPAYSPKVISDEQLKRIHEYLKSIPEPPEVSTLPILSEE